MFAAARKPEAIAALCQADRPWASAVAFESQVRQESRDRRQRARFVSQEDVADINTGRGMDPEKWRERKARDAVLHEQTEALAKALERTGISVCGPSDVTAIGVITGAQEPLNSYRPICFLPEVAQRDRRPMLNELQCFRRLDRAQRKYMRMAVVTNGPTVPLGGLRPAGLAGELKTGAYFELRDRTGKLSRSISRFAQWARETYDIDVVFRGIEFTVAQRAGDDFLSAHLHANVLYTPLRKLKKAEFAAFLVGASQQFDGWWWKDCGKLEDPREAIKYAFKPCELQGLEDAQVRWLYEQTFGVPMVQPLGSFKRWRNETLWIDEQLPDRRVRNEPLWIAEQLPDRRVGRRKHRPVRRRKHRKVRMVEYSSGPRLEICSVRNRCGKPRDPHKIVREDRTPPENVLLGITTPQRRKTPHAEPYALVMNYTACPATPWGRETLDTIAAECEKMLPAWYDNGGPDPDVALALGRGQAAARVGEASKVAPLLFTTRSSTADRRTCGNGGRGPPASMDAPADRSGSQLGVDLGIGGVVEPTTRAGLA